MIQFLAFHQLLSLFLGQIQFCLKRPWSGIRYCLLIKRFAIKKRVNFAYIICNNYGYGCVEVLNLKLFFFFFEKRQCLCRKTYRSFEIHLRNKKISKGFLFRKCCKRRKTCLYRDTFSNITRIIIDWKYQPKVFLFSAGKPGIVEFL